MTEDQIFKIKEIISSIASNAEKEISETDNCAEENVIEIFSNSLSEFIRTMSSSVLKDFKLCKIEDETLLNLTLNAMYKNAICDENCIPPAYFRAVNINEYIFNPLKDLHSLNTVSYEELYVISACAYWWLHKAEMKEFVHPYILYKSLVILIYNYIPELYLLNNSSDEVKKEIIAKCREDYLFKLNEDKMNKIIDNLIEFYQNKESESDNKDEYISKITSLNAIKAEYNKLLEER